LLNKGGHLRTIVFDCEITHESIAELFANIEMIPETERPTDFGNGVLFYERVIYFSSPGGFVTAAETLVNYLNGGANDFLITLVGAGELCSAAFDVFFKACPANKYLLKSAYGMAHEATFYSNIRSEKCNDSFDTFFRKELSKKDVEMYDYYKNVLEISKERISKMKKGKDLYFSNEEMQEMLDRQWGKVMAEREAIAQEMVEEKEKEEMKAKIQPALLNEAK